jgi:hypothetical protein
MAMNREIPPTVGRPRAAQPTVLLPVKMTIDQRKRFKVACAAEELTYGQMITALLDERDTRLARAQRRQAHPLHRPDDVVSV